jgi:hypothetical protein
MGVDIAICLFLGYLLISPNQDAAGKGMIGLPLILLLGCVAASWFLLTRNYKVSALIISGVPALIGGYVLYLTLKKS